MVRERTKKKETRRRGHPLESRNGRSDQSASFLVLIEAVESKLTGIVLLIVRLEGESSEVERKWRQLRERRTATKIGWWSLGLKIPVAKNEL